MPHSNRKAHSKDNGQMPIKPAEDRMSQTARIRLDKKTYDKLLDMSKRKGVGISTLLRMIVLEYLKDKE